MQSTQPQRAQPPQHAIAEMGVESNMQACSRPPRPIAPRSDRAAPTPHARASERLVVEHRSTASPPARAALLWTMARRSAEPPSAPLLHQSFYSRAPYPFSANVLA